MSRYAYCLLVAWAFASCGKVKTPDGNTTKPPKRPPQKPVELPKDDESVSKRKIQPPMAATTAPAATARASVPHAKRLSQSITSYFAGKQGKRAYIQTDKPLYKPGETIWVRSWNLRSRDLTPDRRSRVARLQLVSPKGAVVINKRVRQRNGVITNDFALPKDIQGGQYKLRVLAGGTRTDRPIVVSRYEAPRIKKKLEFLRKAYGVGDTVKATLRLKRPTGEPFAEKLITASITIDGQNLQPVRTTTNRDGGALIKFTLPKKMSLGDGLLTVLVDDGGVTESTSKRIPIVLKKLRFSLFPEGGKLIEGLKTRVYFAAKNTLGKPADVEGHVVDDHGNKVANFSSYWGGLGRFEMTASTGRKFFAVVTKPEGISERYPLPLAEKRGCILNSYDDYDSQERALRVRVRCSKKQTVMVTAVVRENLLDSAAVEASPDKDAVVFLKSAKPAANRTQGIARVTVFSQNREPLAERLVFRNRRARLGISVVPNKQSFNPRDKVTLTVKTTGPNGQPMPASVALSVVNDTVISFADDKTGHMLSRLYLESEIPGKLEEPKFFFDLKEPKSAVALDLIVGTRGWRKFGWRRVLLEGDRRMQMTQKPTSADPSVAGGVQTKPTPVKRPGLAFNDAPKRARRRAKRRNIDRLEGGLDNFKGGKVGAKRPQNRPAPAAAAPRPVEVPKPVAKPRPQNPVKIVRGAKLGRVAAAPAPPPADKQLGGGRRIAKNEALGDIAKAAEPEPEKELKRAPARQRIAAGPKVAGEARAMGNLREADDEEVVLKKDRDWGGKKKRRKRRWGWARVRVFPVPDYSRLHVGPRTDFRDTVYWNPNVATSASGTATVSFYLSDSVTSFRVFGEGIGSGHAGHSEKVFKSNLPFSINVKLPLEVSAGDKVLLPLKVSNETQKPIDVKLDAKFGPLLKLDRPTGLASGQILAGKRESIYYPLSVIGKRGDTPVSFMARASGLNDSFNRKLSVVPVGFPRKAEVSGEIRAKQTHTIEIAEALPGTISASIRFYPSPVATMISGLNGMLRQPNGCFEQASSSNYPNVMVMQYLQQLDKPVDPSISQRSQRFLTSGYRRLTGYESKTKGYEWFGKSPGHEALTAYGLLQFTDMKSVYSAVDLKMIARTGAWLMSRRDGKGGFLRNARALDSFGRASKQVTDAYITYSLSAARITGIDREVGALAKKAPATKDPYVMALMANALIPNNRYRKQGIKVLGALMAQQAEDGSFPGAKESITRSRGRNLLIETTSLTVLAMVEGLEYDRRGKIKPKLRKAVEWLNKNRSGFGRWGATQATVLTLKALTKYAQSQRKLSHPGEVSIVINGNEAGSMRYFAGHNKPIVLDNLAQHFKTGANTIEIVHKGKAALPFSFVAEYRTVKPNSAKDVPITLATKLAKTKLDMGESVRLTATVKNTTDQGLPMTMARIGLPGGLTFQTWQLKELKEKKLIAFYETRAREVIVYFRQMKPNEERVIPIDLLATFPGKYTGPASRAYLYYDDDKKIWTDPLVAEIVPRS